MPFSSVTVRPGVNTVLTPTQNVAGISDSNLIRFRQGLPEKLGGWMRFLGLGAMGSVTRALHAWRDLIGNSRLAVGSTASLKAISTGGTVSTITPGSLVTNPALNISTTQGLKNVTIIDTAVGTLWQYDTVHFNVPVSIGGLLLTGMYQILPGATPTTYLISAATEATSSSTTESTPSFATTLDSPIVTVTLNAHGRSVGGKFMFPINTIVGGLNITGIYTVETVPSANTFTITATANASATATATMNGGLAQYLYWLVGGPTQSGFAGGLGPIGEFAIGEGFVRSTTTSFQTGTPITTTDYHLSNFGELLLANPRGGPVFYWAATSGFTNVVPIGVGPPFNNGMFVSTPARQVVVWGTAASLLDEGTRSHLDPLMVRWCHVDDFFTWKATSLNQAGSFRISTGSEIMGAIQGANQALVFTDVDVWSMQYVGPPEVYRFMQIGTGAGLVGAHACTRLNNSIYYMSNGNFYTIDGHGGLQIIPCPVWDFVFEDLDISAARKVCAASNSLFNEVAFYFPCLSNPTGENSKYVKLNVLEGVWDVGYMDRSAWLDRTIFTKPIGADPTTQFLQQHEDGYSADGAAMNSYVRTGFFIYGDGERSAFVDHFEPDMTWTTQNSTQASAQIQVTLESRKYPNVAHMTEGPITMVSSTPFCTPRLRGKQMRWKIESNDTGSFWRAGLVRYRWGEDGRN